ncbi:hypothetical protein RJ639_045894 [Escallonia herrerae]|uniref:SANT domain-containing protein n=1 Tax=Escallonia herrerae TaxID=1293975 RepID=A0AA89B3T2_9ASTE|nr:hypothetical protein RJ639_045894 [Escallonia herrerae]
MGTVLGELTSAMLGRAQGCCARQAWARGCYAGKAHERYAGWGNLYFPLISPDHWNADEETLILEGIEMYGMGTDLRLQSMLRKSKSQCIDHYDAIYMNSPCFSSSNMAFASKFVPFEMDCEVSTLAISLQDMSRIMGKNREELLAMARGYGETSKGYSTPGEVTMKEVSPFSTGIKSVTISPRLNLPTTVPKSLKCRIAFASYAKLHASSYPSTQIDHLKNQGLDSNVYRCTRMIASYVGNHRVGDALNVFDEMPAKDTVVWNLIIKNYLDMGMKLFEEMPEKNVISWTTMINGSSSVGELN